MEARAADPAAVPRDGGPAAPEDPTVALCLGTYGDPRGVGVSYERGTPEGDHSGPSTTCVTSGV